MRLAIPYYASPSDISNLLPSPVLTAEGTSNFVEPAGVSRAEVFANIPFSDGELRETFSNISAFEVTIDGFQRVFQPSAAALIEVWKDIFLALTAEEVDVSAESGIENSVILRVLEAICAELGHPIELTEATIRVLALPQSSQAISANQAPTTIEHDRHLHGPGRVVFQRKIMPRWTVDKSVEAGHLKDMGDQIWKFLDHCREYVPEQWRDDIDTGVVLAAKDRLKVKRAQFASEVDGERKALVEGAGGQRDWHARMKAKKGKRQPS